MLNRRLQAKKKAAKPAAVVKIVLPDVNQSIVSYIEQESDKWLQSAIDSGHSLYRSLWDYGLAKRDGTEIERIFHKLIYYRFSQKLKTLIGKSSS